MDTETLVCKTFDQLTARELYEVLRLRSEVFVVKQDSVYQDPDGLDYQALHLWLEREGGVPVAYARVLPAGTYLPSLPSIGRVVTREPGRGHGTRIFQAALTAARERLGYRRLGLRSQLQAAPFYERFGFRRVGEPFLYEGLMHVDMELD